MSVVTAGSAPASFEIKSANLPLVALRLKSTNLSLLADDLSRRYGDMPDFFDNEPLVIDLTALSPETGDLDFDALLTLLRRYRVVPIAFKGGNAGLAGGALAAGLVATPDLVALKSSAPHEPHAPENERGVAPEDVVTPTAPLPALIIDKPLRSGQQVYARGRDLVMLAMVNAGAEVIADGHIHVYAPLRGKAIAGARGNVEARIFALSLEAELISIAGIYRTSEKALPAEVRRQPTQVRLVAGPEGDRLVMEPLQS